MGHTYSIHITTFTGLGEAVFWPIRRPTQADRGPSRERDSGTPKKRGSATRPSEEYSELRHTGRASIVILPSASRASFLIGTQVGAFNGC